MVLPQDDSKAKPGFGDGGHVYILKPQRERNALVARNRLTMIWNGDGEIATTEKLEQACQRWAAQRDNPIRVETAAQADKH
jgi:hypothetical protein